MPVKGTCLLFDTPLKEALFDVIELTAYERLKNGQSASLGSIYQTIRKAGVEVDLPTVGQIYNEVLPRDDANFSSEIEIEDYVGATWNNELNRLVEMQDLVGEQQIGDEKPERAVVEFIMKALYGDMVQDVRTKSDMKLLQKALQDGVQRKLGKLDGKKATQKDMVDLVNESLNWETLGITDLNGQLNSIEDLFNSMKQELNNASQDIRDAADPNIVDRWDEYIKNLENATYKLLFRKPDAITVRNESLIAKGFGAKNKAGKETLDWNKLSAFGSLAALRRNSFDALTDAGFSNNVATRVVDTLAQEYIDLRTEIIDRQLNKTDEFAAKAKKLSLEQAGLDALLGGRTMAQWVKDEQIENVEDLAKKAYEFLNKSEYVPAVKRKAVDKLQQFFADNYAKVDEVEAKRAVENILGEQTALEWIKANGIQNQDELNQGIDDALAGRNISPQNETLIRSEFGRILDINNRAEKELKSKEDAAAKYAAKEYTPTKSDLKRLIELYHLGVFDSSYDSALFKTLGVSDLQAKDLNDIKSVAKVASDLARKVVDVKGYNLGADSAVATEFQLMQRIIDRIIERNINNKSTLLKILSFIKRYLNAMLSSLLAMPFTIVENVFSGFKAVLSGLRFNTLNPSQTKQAVQVYGAMLSDVTRTGQSFGEEIGSFATQELFLNTLKFKWKGATAKDWAKNAILGLTMPVRIGLLAFDSANKAALTNKIFYNNVYQSLVKNNLMSPSDAKVFLNDMLYGKSFEDAKTLAREIAEKRNNELPVHLRDKITDTYVIRLANDVVKANLFTSGVFQSKEGKAIVDAVVKGSYHVAGVSLGHEPNNPISRGIKNYRDGRRRNEQKYTKEKDWNGLAKHKMTTIFMDNFLIQFAGGATNWMVLRAKEGLGAGILTGFSGEWNKDVMYVDNKDLQNDITKRERARADIARSIVGLTYTGLFTLLGFSLTGGGDDEEMKKRLKALNEKKKKTEKDYEDIMKLEGQLNAYTRIKQHKDKDKWFRKMAPDAHLIKYYIDNSNHNGLEGTALGMVEYVKRTYMGNERFGVQGKLTDAAKLIVQGDTDAAFGTLASIVGDKFSVPMYRPYKEYVRVVTNPFSNNPTPPSKYVPPTNVEEGLFGGGLMQDLGFFNNPSITAIPGVGPATLKRFKKMGIENIDDLGKKIDWTDAQDEDGFLLDKPDRVKAKKWLEEYKKTQ